MTLAPPRSGEAVACKIGLATQARLSAVETHRTGQWWARHTSLQRSEGDRQPRSRPLRCSRDASSENAWLRAGAGSQVKVEGVSSSERRCHFMVKPSVYASAKRTSRGGRLNTLLMRFQRYRNVHAVTDCPHMSAGRR